MKEAQGEYLRAMLEAIDLAAREGFPNVIVLTGSKNHMSYEEGADNAVAFLGAVKAKADELDYDFIAKSIADLRFRGFVTHEWTPSKASEVAMDLRNTVALMTV